MSVLHIGIDKSDGPDTTVYTIPHELAFEMLERQVCAQFHTAGDFITNTKARFEDGKITFTVTVTKQSGEVTR